jgi:NAD(P)-dependent dehydrogenase (short-subunit alcohol dehydrogenase family)
MAGRTVLVTGAIGGIGRAAALGLARMGADLAVCGRDPQSTEDAAGELSAAGGGPVEVTDLAEAGYVVKEKDGRRNRYQIQAHLPLPGSASRERTIGEVLAILAGVGGEATA